MRKIAGRGKMGLGIVKQVSTVVRKIAATNKQHPAHSNVSLRMELRR